MLDNGLQTERLLLSNYTENDLDHYHRLRSDPMVWRYSTKTPVKNIEESKVELELILEKYRKEQWDFQGLFLKSTGTYIGEAGILSLIQRTNRAVVGYNLLPQYWGNGYGTEITNALVKYLFEELEIERIEALVLEGNEASRKVLEKCGFKEEGFLRHFALINGQYRNVHYYGIIRADLECNT